MVRVFILLGMMTSHLDKDQREPRDASDVAHQGVVRHTSTTKLQC
jgi:hypothetical protein